MICLFCFKSFVLQVQNASVDFCFSEKAILGMVDKIHSYGMAISCYEGYYTGIECSHLAFAG